MSSAEQSANTAAFNAEQAQRQDEALRAVTLISRATGGEIPIISSAEAISPEPGAYILDADLCQRGRMTDVNFTVEPRMLSGAANSAHAVLAGELGVDYANKSASSTTKEVAAKCYVKRERAERYQRVQREIVISQDMAARGELALEPVAVAVAPETVANGAVVLLTKFDRELFTLDNHPWGRGLTAENIETAVQAVDALGRFNRFGFRHADAKIKNVAGRLTGEMGMIDFETTTKIDIHDPIEAAGAAHGDLGMLVDSLADKGFFNTIEGDTSYDRAQNLAAAVRRICEGGYLTNWESSPPDTQMAVLEAVNEVAQAVIERHSLIPVAF